MTPYLIVKHAHMGLAYLTVLSFAGRGILMMHGSPWLTHKLARVAPHVIDTLLLACGVALVLLGGWPVLESPWLLAKLGALLVYVGLGTVALKRGKTQGVRIAAFYTALLTVLYIIAVAKTKMVLPV